MVRAIKPSSVTRLVKATYSYQSKAREQHTLISLIGAIVAIETASAI